LGVALGAEVTVFTTSPGKAGDAKKLGAHQVVVSRDADAMAKQAGTFDFIVNTVSAKHDLDPFVAALKRDGTMTMVGVPPDPHTSPSVWALIFGSHLIPGP